MTTQALEVVAPIRVPARSSRQRHRRLRVLARNPLVVLGLALVVFFVAVAALAGVLAPADPIAMKTSVCSRRRRSPHTISSFEH